MSSAEQIGRSPNGHLAAAGRRPLPDLYDLVQGRENRAVICRCQKTGIGGKSADHRPILKACDAAFTHSNKSLTVSNGEKKQQQPHTHNINNNNNNNNNKSMY